MKKEACWFAATTSTVNGAHDKTVTQSQAKKTQTQHSCTVLSCAEISHNAGRAKIDFILELVRSVPQNVARFTGWSACPQKRHCSCSDRSHRRSQREAGTSQQRCCRKDLKTNLRQLTCWLATRASAVELCVASKTEKRGRRNAAAKPHRTANCWSSWGWTPLLNKNRLHYLNKTRTTTETKTYYWNNQKPTTETPHHQHTHDWTQPPMTENKKNHYWKTKTTTEKKNAEKNHYWTPSSFPSFPLSPSLSTREIPPSLPLPYPSHMINPTLLSSFPSFPPPLLHRSWSWERFTRSECFDTILRTIQTIGHADRDLQNDSSAVNVNVRSCRQWCQPQSKWMDMPTVIFKMNGSSAENVNVWTTRKRKVLTSFMKTEDGENEASRKGIANTFARHYDKLFEPDRARYRNTERHDYPRTPHSWVHHGWDPEGHQNTQERESSGRERSQRRDADELWRGDERIDTGHIQHDNRTKHTNTVHMEASDN